MDVETILLSLNIVASSKSDRNLFMLCPFHEDTHPSVSMRRDTGEWVCGKCKLAGDLNRFLTLFQEKNPDARVDQIDRSSEAFTGTASLFDMPQEEAELDLEEAKRLIQLCYDYYAEDYLSSRNISQELAKRLQLGYNPQNKRVIIPAYSFDGEFLGVTGRTIINERPKYVHTLFGKHIPFHSYYNTAEYLPRNIETDKQKVVLVEGSFDAFRILKFLHSLNISSLPQREHFLADVDGVVVVYGSNITKNLCQYLGTKRTRFILCFDADEAGLKGEEKAAENLLPFGVVCKVGNKPQGKDVGDYDEKDFRQLTLNAYPF